ncbi:MAG: SURF1 family protein [Actinobacteria bacterium]|nr:SURF1 family protein [Actinomycetota bacterium]NDA94906.1 SURF1 family protein [Actinomycetota bacterium]NDH81115.1 SURF1 family protein [Actinomycetota bacterium]
MEKEQYAFLKTLVAISLVLLCLWAAQWQYQRGVDRHARNVLIAEQSQLPPIEFKNLLGNIADYEWRKISLKGSFDDKNQILLRNRYHDGMYGFEQLTLFVFDERKIWVDRGWVKAGSDATVPPQLQPTNQGLISIDGRLRLDSSLPRGKFFAVANDSERNLVSQLDARRGIQTEKFYIDLISASDDSMNPDVPVELPELSDGPHMAYALQWLFFAGLVIYGRRLIRKSA